MRKTAYKSFAPTGNFINLTLIDDYSTSFDRKNRLSIIGHNNNNNNKRNSLPLTRRKRLYRILQIRFYNFLERPRGLFATSYLIFM
jgi:hypothetical protein